MVQNKSLWKTIGGIALITAIIGTVATVIAALIPFYPSGDILSPRENGIVPTTFTVSGELRGISENHHVWLAIKIGRLLWPQKEIARNASNWTETISERGVSGKGFAVVLFMVKNDGHQEIENWFHLAMQTNEWPGMEEISNRTDLAVVQVALE